MCLLQSRRMFPILIVWHPLQKREKEFSFKNKTQKVTGQWLRWIKPEIREKINLSCPFPSPKFWSSVGCDREILNTYMCKIYNEWKFRHIFDTITHENTCRHFIILCILGEELQVMVSHAFYSIQQEYYN